MTHIPKFYVYMLAISYYVSFKFLVYTILVLNTVAVTGIHVEDPVEPFQ